MAAEELAEKQKQVRLAAEAEAERFRLEEQRIAEAEKLALA